MSVFKGPLADKLNFKSYVYEIHTWHNLLYV